jgi:hypothetical protein
MDGTTIHLPDIQVEYETREGGIEGENLELLSENYREQGIRGKAERDSDSTPEAAIRTAFDAHCATRSQFERFFQYDADGVPTRRATTSRIHEISQIRSTSPKSLRSKVSTQRQTVKTSR